MSVPTPNPVFNSDDFVVESGGLSETTANSLYLRKLIDDSTDNELTVGGLLTPTIDSITPHGNILIGNAHTGGWV